MKQIALSSIVLICYLAVSCAADEAPVYQPSPKGSAVGEDSGSANQPNTGNSSGNGTASNNDTQKAPAPTTPNQPSTPPATPPPASTPPTATAGVAATGRTLLLQSCATATCHTSAANTINANTSQALVAGRPLNPAHQNTALNAHFTPPAAGAAANEHSHIIAYLTTRAPVFGPNLPQ